MRLLLDTHVFLWLQATPARLGNRLTLLADPETELLVSAASAWEIAIKSALGRLPLPEPPTQWVTSRIAMIRAQPVAVELAHALAVADLAPVHRDPFDRLLVCQSRLLGAPLVTADPVFDRYDVELLRVGRRG
jgi:PIN domain nuclease of toxin-antitoxin system